jgi:hypothetical protein
MFELLLDDGTQVQSGDLKDFQGLPKLGGENQRLALTLAEVLIKPGAHACS